MREPRKVAPRKCSLGVSEAQEKPIPVLPLDTVPPYVMSHRVPLGFSQSTTTPCYCLMHCVRFRDYRTGQKQSGMECCKYWADLFRG